MSVGTHYIHLMKMATMILRLMVGVAEDDEADRDDNDDDDT